MTESTLDQNPVFWLLGIANHLFTLTQLGHQSRCNHVYLGVELEDALSIAEKIDT